MMQKTALLVLFLLGTQVIFYRARLGLPASLSEVLCSSVQCVGVNVTGQL